MPAWLRRPELNRVSQGYEPSELPALSSRVTYKNLLLHGVRQCNYLAVSPRIELGPGGLESAVLYH
jgi:hypothetical protein